jgi:hypothetical protein
MPPRRLWRAESVTRGGVGKGDPRRYWIDEKMVRHFGAAPDADLDGLPGEEIRAQRSST